jgi:cell division protein FtsB
VPLRARPASAGTRAASTVTEPLPRPSRRPRPGLSRPGLSRPGLARPGSGTAAGPGRLAGEAARRAAAARRLGGSRTPFVLLVLGLLGGGLVCLLVINTTLSAASYQINTLQQGNAQLSQQEQALQQQIAKEQAPATIEQRAYQLGMRSEQRLNFVNARTGKVSRQPAVLRGVPNAPGFTP